MPKIENINFDEHILKLPKNKMCIMTCPKSEERKKIHQYLEINYPSIKKISLQSDLVEKIEFSQTFYKCYYCNYKRVSINEYHYGSMESNKDEYRTGTCPKCGENITFEMNYDDWDNVIRLYKKNIIIVGDYVKHNNFPKHAERGDVSKEEFTRIMKNVTLYEIDAPEKLINHKKLKIYIDSKLKDII